MTETECSYCGEFYDVRGIGAHEASCDASLEKADAGLDVDLDDEVEAHVASRDDGTCVRCGGDEDVRLHEVDPSVGHEKTNVVTLCADCEDDVDGLHPRTKRTKIRRGTDA